MRIETVRRRRQRGGYPKTQDSATPERIKKLPKYFEAEEVNAIKSRAVHC